MWDSTMETVVNSAQPRTFIDKLGEALHRMAYHDNPMNWIPQPDTPAITIKTPKGEFVYPAVKARNLSEEAKEGWRESAYRFIYVICPMVGIEFRVADECIWSEWGIELAHRPLDDKEIAILRQRASAYDRVLEQAASFMKLETELWAMIYHFLDIKPLNVQEELKRERLEREVRDYVRRRKRK